MALRILIGCGKEKNLRQLSQFLQENGYLVMGEAQEGYDLLRKIHTIYPDVVLIDHSIRGLSGSEVAEVIISDRICPVIATISESETSYYSRLIQEPFFAEIIKPINKSLLLNSIDLLIKASRNIQKLERQVAELKEKIDSKSEIDKAKSLLMKHMNLTEEEAHRRIQKQSMDRGISKVQVARAIILTYDH